MELNEICADCVAALRHLKLHSQVSVTSCHVLAFYIMSSFLGMMQFKLSSVQNTIYNWLVAIEINFALQFSVPLNIPIKFRRSLLLDPEDQTFR
jgi:hypothetical protein